MADGSKAAGHWSRLRRSHIVQTTGARPGSPQHPGRRPPAPRSCTPVVVGVWRNGGQVTFQSEWGLLRTPSPDGSFVFSVCDADYPRRPCLRQQPTGSLMDIVEKAGGFTMSSAEVSRALEADDGATEARNFLASSLHSAAHACEVASSSALRTRVR